MDQQQFTDSVSLKTKMKELMVFKPSIPPLDKITHFSPDKCSQDLLSKPLDSAINSLNNLGWL